MANVVLNDAIKMVASYVPEQATVVAWGSRTVDMIGSTVSPFAQKIVSVAQNVFQKEEVKLTCHLLAGVTLFFAGLSLLFESSSELQIVPSVYDVEVDLVEKKSSGLEKGVDESKKAELAKETNNSKLDQLPSAAAEGKKVQLEGPIQEGEATKDIDASSASNENGIAAEKRVITVKTTRAEEVPSSLFVRVVQKVEGIFSLVLGAVTIYDAYSRLPQELNGNRF